MGRDGGGRTVRQERPRRPRQRRRSSTTSCCNSSARRNGKALNSGIFFRCIPGQYQNGYEAQIQNGFKDDDRTKPVDFGTGAIYRRVPARKVVGER